MARMRGQRVAFGKPGIEPCWTQGNKDGVGTAYSDVADRYRKRSGCRPMEVWKPTRKALSVRRGMTPRIQSPAPFMLHWSADEWQQVQDTTSSPTVLQIDFVDIPIPTTQSAPIRFTFYWTAERRWEGKDYEMVVLP